MPRRRTPAPRDRAQREPCMARDARSRGGGRDCDPCPVIVGAPVTRERWQGVIDAVPVRLF